MKMWNKLIQTIRRLFGHEPEPEVYVAEAPRLQAFMMPMPDQEMLRMMNRTVQSVTSGLLETELIEPEIITLSKADSERFAEALINPPVPSQKMKDAVRRYKARRVRDEQSPVFFLKKPKDNRQENEVTTMTTDNTNPAGDVIPNVKQAREMLWALSKDIGASVTLATGQNTLTWSYLTLGTRDKKKLDYTDDGGTGFSTDYKPLAEIRKRDLSTEEAILAELSEEAKKALADVANKLLIMQIKVDVYNQTTQLTDTYFSQAGWDEDGKEMVIVKSGRETKEPEFTLDTRLDGEE